MNKETVTEKYLLKDCILKFFDSQGKIVDLNELERPFNFDLQVPEMVFASDIDKNFKGIADIKVKKFYTKYGEEGYYYVRSVKLPVLSYEVSNDIVEFEVEFERLF